MEWNVILDEDMSDVLPMLMTLFCFLLPSQVSKGCLTYVIIKVLNLFVDRVICAQTGGNPKKLQ